jgi:hypothetical protein
MNGIGRLAGVTAEIITPNDATRDKRGDIMVVVNGTIGGKSIHREFYTTKDSCDAMSKTNKPIQAPSSDIN